MENQKIAVLLYGQPGSGKGTQATSLEEKNGFSHFDTGRFLESVINDPKNADDPVIQAEKKKFDSGELMTPALALAWVSKGAREISAQGKSIVFSGSPRTVEECVGDENTPGLLQVLEEEYGKDNVYAFFIDVSDETSIARNSARIICKETGKVVKSADECEGEVTTRSLDKPEVIKARLIEYRNRTIPALEKVRELGFKVTDLNGEGEPEHVYKEMLEILPIN